MEFHIFTDGACSNNGSVMAKGGYGVVIFQEGKIIEILRDYTIGTTNNREELKAMLEALKYLYHTVADYHSTSEQIICAKIYTDSAYVFNIVTSWAKKWYYDGWRRKGNKPIENLDIIKEIYEKLTDSNFNNICQVTFKKVAGHSKDLGNELADAVATNNISKLRKLLNNNKSII